MNTVNPPAALAGNLPPPTLAAIAPNPLENHLGERKPCDAEGPVAPVDTPKVAALKHAISTGSYQVDAIRIAGKMAGFESKLFK